MVTEVEIDMCHWKLGIIASSIKHLRNWFFFFFELLVFLVVFSEYFSELVMSTKPCETSDIKEGICLTLCLLCLC